MSPELQKRFWAKVTKTKGCWNWQACVNESGYGIFGIQKKRIDRAHRISWRLTKGEIPKGIFVCHACDNPRCVKPAHLFLGSNQDNVTDMVRKGRNSKPPPMAGWNRIQHDEDTIALLGFLPDTEIARLVGKTKYAIQRERKRRGIPALVSLTRFKKNPERHPRWGRSGG